MGYVCYKLRVDLLLEAIVHYHNTIVSLFEYKSPLFFILLFDRYKKQTATFEFYKFINV
jgi:hypothetical protein